MGMYQVGRGEAEPFISIEAIEIVILLSCLLPFQGEIFIRRQSMSPSIAEDVLRVPCAGHIHHNFFEKNLIYKVLDAGNHAKLRSCDKFMCRFGMLWSDH